MGGLETGPAAQKKMTGQKETKSKVDKLGMAKVTELGQ